MPLTHRAGVQQLTLTERVSLLEAQVKGLLQILQAKGIDYPWLSPAEAAPLLRVSREFIYREIRAAERDRRSSDYKLGVHYRHKGRPSAARATYLINVSKFAEVMGVPLEERVS